ncbi:MAG TPA: indole-3-glycerol phosphate synthase TrpC [Candidatus Eisenbacteria bacterium]|nr:indole-3-glycerol phosphate synthase TrpC [Candidatus Eisenbacteria bacterium]
MILDDIVRHKKIEIEAAKRAAPPERLRASVAALPPRRAVFAGALSREGRVAVIAEIKKKSPSKGLFRDDFDAVRIARDYESAGASALSVLTDERFFGGSAQILRDVRAAVRLPILRKDFILDEYQVYESRLMGADAILLIAAILSEDELRSFGALAASLGLDALYEVHGEEDARKVEAVRPGLVGINNRDLRTFEVDTTLTARLAPRFLGHALVVSESGIQSREDLLYLKGLGVRAALVGESLMKQKDVAGALRRLLGE